MSRDKCEECGKPLGSTINKCHDCGGESYRAGGSMAETWGYWWKIELGVRYNYLQRVYD